MECIHVMWHLASRCVLFHLWAILAPCRLFLCESLGNRVRQPGSRSESVLHSLSSVGCFLEATSSLVVWLFHWCVHAFTPLRPAVTSCLWWVGFPASSSRSSLWQRLWCMSARLSNIWVRNSLVKPWKNAHRHCSTSVLACEHIFRAWYTTVCMNAPIHVEGALGKTSATTCLDKGRIS